MIDTIEVALSTVLGCRCKVYEDGSHLEIYLLSNGKSVNRTEAEAITRKAVKNIRGERTRPEVSLSIDGGQTWIPIIEAPKENSNPAERSGIGVSDGEFVAGEGLEGCVCDPHVRVVEKEPADPSLIEALRKAHYETTILGMRGLIGNTEWLEILCKLDFTMRSPDPYTGAEDEGLVASRSRTFGELLLGIIGRPSDDQVESASKLFSEAEKRDHEILTQRGWAQPSFDEKRSMEHGRRAFLYSYCLYHYDNPPHIYKRFSEASKEQRAEWLNKLIDRIYAMKMNPKEEKDA